MGFFDDIAEGIFGSDDMSDQIGDLIDFGKGQAEMISGMGQGGFNMANLLMPVLLSELGITAVTDARGNITGFERAESKADKLRSKLEMTTLKQLRNFQQGKGPLPVGLQQRNQQARQTLRQQMGNAGFSAGDTPFEEAKSRLRRDIASMNDAFRFGQFDRAANLMNVIDTNQRADLGTLLTGAIGAQQSPLPWLQSLIQNTGSLSGLAGGAGQVQGQPGLLGTALGVWAGAGFPGVCWVARAVYGEDNPDWLRFRHWMICRAPMWLNRLYRKHGPALARLIKKCPVIGTMLRPLMDSVI